MEWKGSSERAGPLHAWFRSPIVLVDKDHMQSGNLLLIIIVLLFLPVEHITTVPLVFKHFLNPFLHHFLH